MIGTVRIRLLTLGVATATVLSLPACATGPDQPETIAEEFAAALDAGDVAGAAALTTDPAAAETTIGALFEGLGNDDPSVSVAGTGDGDTFDLDVRWTFGEGRDWSYRTTGSATEDPGADAWRVRWDPAVLSPELAGGASLQYLTTAGAPPTIFDRAGQPLMGEQVVTVVNLDATADPAAVAPVLATVVPTITAESLIEQVAAAGGGAAGVITLREDDLALIEERLAALPGVTLVPQTRLLTTERALASPVWSGLAELWQEGQDASAGWVVRRVAADGATTRVAGESGPEAPDLTSTIDLGLQRRAEEVLATFDTPAVIVGIEPATGAIRTMAQNEAADAEGPVAATGLYPPGSTFKVVTTAAALGAGLAEPGTVLPCPGVASIGSRTIPNDENFDLGSVPLHTAFAFSCNTTMGRLALDLPPEALRATAERLGLGIDYVTPGLVTVTGDVPVADTDAARVEAAIGQGEVTASPFGMALVAASVANGRTPAPMLVEGQPATPDRDAEPVPENVLAALREMMRETVIEGTAGTLRDIPDLTGKTGTAEYGDNVGAHGWFIGSQDNLAFAVFVAGADGSAPAVEAAGRWLRG
ncbi:putative penicillin-binding protein [Rhodococcus gordoniae]|uniref:Putative penicillin-binding protein n=1 Tax=Rhodococcus gordoniae TaxID=223392 RepID=A0A379LZP7_9NOCA|nr:penicillin-binding transpeptidase domain-containing protein [Rhodococcus gordoniae]SUE15554.1 putative penicillin-binding protein [Rhodococcus gordoniae]